jgi:hypothetical protein
VSRWWDGTQWTGHVAADSAGPPGSAPRQEAGKSHRRVWLALCIAALIVVAAAGTVIGLTASSGPTKKEVDGTFVLNAGDADSMTSFGDGCEGDGGYGDINSSTSVVLTNKDGKEIDRTPLGPGEASGFTCTFHFTLQVTKGSPYYVITISHRGQMQYTWDELTAPDAVDITLGDG